jgi:hypothetical protein
LKETNAKCIQILVPNGKELKDILENSTIIHSILEDILQKRYFAGFDTTSQTYINFTRSLDGFKRALEEFSSYLEDLNKNKQLDKATKNSKTRKLFEDKSQSTLSMANVMNEKHEILGNEAKNKGMRDSGSLPGTPKGSNENLNQMPKTNQYITTGGVVAAARLAGAKVPLAHPRGKESADWLFLSINRAQAEKSLAECKEGAFLVRSSSVPNCFALSRWKPGGQHEHFIIAPAEGGFIIQDSGDFNVYPSLNDLIASTPELNDFRPLGDVRRRMYGGPPSPSSPPSSPTVKTNTSMNSSSLSLSQTQPQTTYQNESFNYQDQQDSYQDQTFSTDQTSYQQDSYQDQTFSTDQASYQQDSYQDQTSYANQQTTWNQKTPIQTPTPSIPLPSQNVGEWRQAVAPDGRIYYYNTVTKKTSWKKPE